MLLFALPPSIDGDKGDKRAVRFCYSVPVDIEEPLFVRGKCIHPIMSAHSGFAVFELELLFVYPKLFERVFEAQGAPEFFDLNETLLHFIRLFLPGDHLRD